MSRRRSLPRPAPSVGVREGLRLGSLVLLLGVMGLLYLRARDPATWSWFATIPAPSSTANSPSQSLATAEVISPGANDTEEEQRTAFGEEAQVLADREPLTREEMFAYWRLFQWAGATSFSDLWRRSNPHLLFAQMFEAADDHRGELVSLELHVKRVLKHAAGVHEPERPAVFEAWGATDESRTFPYCVLFSEKPSQLPLGDNLSEELRFAGYFLKVLPYEDKLGTRRGAPLLIGRVQWHADPAAHAFEQSRRGSTWAFWLAVIGFLAFLAARWMLRSRVTVANRGDPGDKELQLSQWLDDVQPVAAAPPPATGPASRDAGPAGNSL